MILSLEFLSFAIFAQIGIIKTSTVFIVIRYTSKPQMTVKTGYSVMSVEVGCIKNVLMFSLVGTIQEHPTLVLSASNAKKLMARMLE